MVKVLTKDISNNNYDAAIPPVLTVAPGELFQLETPSILTHAEAFPKTTVPVVGPVWVEDAKPGSVLKVEIVELKLTAGKGAIAVIPGKGAWGDGVSKPSYKVVNYDDKYAYFNDTIKVPLRPMVRKISVAPIGESIDCHATGEYGGNMDITDITKGASVYLPVFVEGALLACGDIHAAMGDLPSALFDCSKCRINLSSSSSAMLRSPQCIFRLLLFIFYLPAFPVNCPAGK